MGCDIHLYGEKFVQPKWWQFWKKGEWISIDKWEYDEDEGCVTVKRENRIYTGGRSYNVFAALCGVRRNCFTNDPPYITRPNGVPPNCSQEYLSEIKSWGNDGHSHAYLTLKQMQDWQGWDSYGSTTNDFCKEVFTKLSSFSIDPNHVRICFFFDN